MKYIFLVFFSLSFVLNSFSQDTGLVNNFENGLPGWSVSDASVYGLSIEEDQLRINATNAGSNWQIFKYNFNTLDLKDHPYLGIKIKSETPLRVRIDFEDTGNRTTNGVPLFYNIVGDGVYRDYFFNFEGLFRQTDPSVANVNQSAIRAIVVFFNPGGGDNSFTGTVFFDSLKIGSEMVPPPPVPGIRINQIGFYPEKPKVGIVAWPGEATEFQVLNVENEDEVVYTGQLGPQTYWDASGEDVRQADFSDFETPGKYKLFVDGIGSSYEFEIKDLVHKEVLKGGLKSYYYQRASMPIEAAYAGIYARPAGHPDNQVTVHSTAASSSRPAGSKISSPGGWYDAGDYGKYIVNSGISTYSLLSLYEQYYEYFDTL
ncbi:MAG: cellulase N-terminal Ig-like domain-containing protein, partial [Cytophagaceae bacterium]